MKFFSSTFSDRRRFVLLDTFLRSDEAVSKLTKLLSSLLLKMKQSVRLKADVIIASLKCSAFSLSLLLASSLSLAPIKATVESVNRHHDNTLGNTQHIIRSLNTTRSLPLCHVLLCCLISLLYMWGELNEKISL